MHEELKAFARAIAAANGHPDPDAYVAQVEAKYQEAAQPAAPAAPMETPAT